ncbi:MAG: hypothetical protein ABI286_11605 [Edaphobacter sp.]
MNKTIGFRYNWRLPEFRQAQEQVASGSGRYASLPVRWSRTARSRPDFVRVSARVMEEAEGSMVMDRALVDASWSA